jgi:hypothetical protein
VHQGYDPPEVYALLRSTHVPALTEEQQLALADYAAGMSYDEIGERLSMDSRTARGIVEAVEKTIAMGCGLPRRNPFVTGLWFALHASCERRCTARAMALLTGEEASA